MPTERTTGACADDELATRLSAKPPVRDSHESSHDGVVRLAFRERPYYDQMLLKTHPSKVYFDTFVLQPTTDGYVPVLVSSALVDKAIRH